MSHANVALSPDTRNMRSPNLWQGCPVTELRNKAIPGTFWMDDFMSFNDTSDNGWEVVGDASPPALFDSTNLTGGWLKMQTSNSDNNEAYISAMNDAGSMVNFNTGIADVFYEARFYISSVTDMSLFVGLTNVGMCAANMMVDSTGALADDEYVGFRVINSDSNGADCVYNTASGGGETIHLEEASGVSGQTLVADTVAKLGMRYNLRDNRLYYYANGQLCEPSGVAATATNFPNGIALVPTFGIKTGTTAHVNLFIDWVCCAVLLA